MPFVNSDLRTIQGGVKPGIVESEDRSRRRATEFRRNYRHGRGRHKKNRRCTKSAKVLAVAAISGVGITIHGTRVRICDFLSEPLPVLAGAVFIHLHSRRSETVSIRFIFVLRKV